MKEHQIYEQISRYLRRNYPDVIYRFDLAADLKLTMGQARKHKIIHPKRGYPDLFIAEPSPKCTNGLFKYHGLYIEIKKENTRLKKKDGSWTTDHVREQAQMLEQLNEKGYCAKFACGFKEVKQIIDAYLMTKKGGAK